MSKTTPEEAKALAAKHGHQFVTGDKALWFSTSELAALIDEVIQKTPPTQTEVVQAVRDCHLKLTCNSYIDMKRALDKFVQNRIEEKESNHEFSGFGSTGNNPEQSGDSSLPIDMAPNEEDEAIRAKELPNIPWTGYLHPAPREDSDT